MKELFYGILFPLNRSPECGHSSSREMEHRLAFKRCLHAVLIANYLGSWLD